MKLELATVSLGFARTLPNTGLTESTTPIHGVGEVLLYRDDKGKLQDIEPITVSSVFPDVRPDIGRLAAAHGPKLS